MAVYSSEVYQSLFLTQVQQDLEVNAVLLKDRFKPYLIDENVQAVDDLCKKAGQESKIRITLIDREGVVLGDSERSPVSMENHATRIEFMDALAGRTGSSERFSQTLRRNMMYVAIPIQLGNDNLITHSLRTSVSIELIYQGQRNFYLKLLFPAFLIALLSAALSWYLSRRIAQPLIQMKNGANRFAEGDLDVPITLPDSEEISSLAQALNKMSQQLNQRILATLEQRRELETILSSMGEGVVAVDRNTRTLNINKAACSLLNVRTSPTKNTPLIEIVRNPDLHELVSITLSSEQRQERQISAADGCVLNVNGNPVFSIEGQITGAVIVLSDVTKQAKLETMRKDFVANVSHELKTPITSIKGYVETLIDTDQIDAATRQRFLEIVAKQTDRLHNIIEDLLELSRLDDENFEVYMSSVSLNSVVDSAVEACSRLLEKKNAEILVEASQEIFINANAPLLEQAVINLLDNAIKYSQVDCKIYVKVSRYDNYAVIRISDQGKGIAAKHHTRIFERFYRIDKARTPSSGSTGLGLAIVKHIVLLHRGEVTLQSIEGKGSSFTITIPF